MLIRVSLRVNHPTQSAESLIERFPRSPKFAHSVGAPRVTPRGQLLGGNYRSTYLSFDVGIYDSFSVGLAAVLSFGQSVRDVLAAVEETEGTSEATVYQDFSDTNGVLVAAEELSALASLCLGLGFGFLGSTVDEPTARPPGCPSNAVPIDQYEPMRAEAIDAVMVGVAARPGAWLGVDSEGEVWTADDAGVALSHGAHADYPQTISLRPFRLSLRIDHPTESAESLLRSFPIAPRVAHSVGERRVTPRGRELGGRYPATYLSFDLGQYETSTEAIESLLEFARPLKEALTQIKAGGGAAQVLLYQPYSDTNGVGLALEEVAALASLSLSFGFAILGGRQSD